MSNALFNRAWSIDIVPPGREDGVRYTNDGADSNALHMMFEIERTLASSANKGKFTLANLTPDNRSNLSQGSVINLRAGYVDNCAVLFQGFIKKVESSQSGPDVLTVIEAGDGEPMITYGNVHLSYSETVSLARVLQDVARSLSVQLGGQVYQLSGHLVQGIPNVSFPRLSKSGPTKKVLDELLLPRNLLWSIQCGTLLIQSRKGTINLLAEVLSPETGMLETPTRTSTGIKVKALLNPRLVPGAAMQIQSANQAVCGNFRAIKCTYKGDSEGADWSVDIEGEALVAPLAPVPISQKKDDYKKAIDADDGDVEDGE